MHHVLAGSRGRDCRFANISKSAASRCVAGSVWSPCDAVVVGSADRGCAGGAGGRCQDAALEICYLDCPWEMRALRGSSACRRSALRCILVGRSTFSAAHTFATRVDAWTSAIFVGEPTGSKPNHYGNEAPFTLPHSGIRGTLSSGWNQPVTSRDYRVWIPPDIPVQQTSRHYFDGQDPVLDRGVAVAHKLR